MAPPPFESTSAPTGSLGSSLFMLKAVLNGRGDEIVDLAKTNLWR